MGTRPAGAVEQWRGFDPGRPGECSYNHLLVRAPCDAVARALQEHRRMPNQMGDLLAGAKDLIGHLREEPVFIYQLCGHEWTQVEDFPRRLLDNDLAQDLSRQLNTLAFRYDFCKISGGSDYALFDGGDLFEAFNICVSMRGTTFKFSTWRGTRLDIESPAECYAQTERVVKRLGIFIAWLPWDYDLESGHTELDDGWRRDDFAAAKVLYHAEVEQVPRNEEADTKLIIRESSDEPDRQVRLDEDWGLRLDEWRWTAGDDLDWMIRSLHGRVSSDGKILSLHGRVSPRKLRLFACACCRRLWHQMVDPRSRVAVETVERFVDGQATRREMDRAYADAGRFLGGSPPQYYAEWCRGEMAALFAAHRVEIGPASGSAKFEAIGAACGAACQVTSRYSDKAECDALVGLLRDIIGDPFKPMPTIDPAWLSWNDETVVALAETIYEKRAFDRMPILGDALEDAGCGDEVILGHCRSGGEHVRGCWVVDALLGRILSNFR